jgi:hypothetical protein
VHTRWTANTLVLALSSIACDEQSSEVPPTFTELRERVLTPGCVFATCHKSGATSAGMMNLEGTDDEVHARLVDVPAAGITGRIRVIAGDPDTSYVMEKLTSDTPAAGERMPLDAPLEPDRIELVRAWIEAGAAND